MWNLMIIGIPGQIRIIPGQMRIIPGQMRHTRTDETNTRTDENNTRTDVQVGIISQCIILSLQFYILFAF